MSLKWVDVQEIAIQLAEAHPDIDPLTVNFVKLRNLVMALPDFDDIPDRGVARWSCSSFATEAALAAWLVKYFRFRIEARSDLTSDGS